MNVDIVRKQERRDAGEALIVREPLQDCALPVHGKNRAEVVAARLLDERVGVELRGVLEQPPRFCREHLQLVFAEHAVENEKAIPFEFGCLLPAYRDRRMPSAMRARIETRKPLRLRPAA